MDPSLRLEYILEPGNRPHIDVLIPEFTHWVEVCSQTSRDHYQAWLVSTTAAEAIALVRSSLAVNLPTSTPLRVAGPSSCKAKWIWKMFDVKGAKIFATEETWSKIEVGCVLGSLHSAFSVHLLLLEVASLPHFHIVLVFASILAMPHGHQDV